MKNFYLLISCFVMVMSLACAQQGNPPYIEGFDDSEISLEKIIDGIDIPWGMVFIDNNEFLVTDREGLLYHVKNGEKTAVKGLPEIHYNGQGGLLDLAIDNNFGNNNFLYFTASVSGGGGGEGSNTALYRANYINYNLTDLKLLYKASPNSNKGQHYGSKILIDSTHIYFSIGDRGNRDVNPQDITRDGGKIYRINLDGSIPSDNPFSDIKNAKKAIWSYGHRNPQGIIFGPKENKLWINEHGPRGGDEINIIEKFEKEDSLKNPIETRNYGWPLASYGINYSGTKFTDQTSLDGTVQPIYYWIPSIAPSGFVMLKSNIYPKWKGSLFVGSLSFEYLERLQLDGEKVIKREKILDNIGRVRNIIEGPDGFLYVSVENKGIFKIIPNIP